MSAYDALAASYDDLTVDVQYETSSRSCSAAAAFPFTPCWIWPAAPAP